MSILDNEGHDLQGFGNTPRASKIEVLCACADSCAKDAEIEQLRALCERSADLLRNWQQDREKRILTGLLPSETSTLLDALDAAVQQRTTEK